MASQRVLKDNQVILCDASSDLQRSCRRGPKDGFFGSDVIAIIQEVVIRDRSGPTWDFGFADYSCIIRVSWGVKTGYCPFGSRLQSHSHGLPWDAERDQHLSKKLFVGGLSWDTSDDSLREAFEQFGAVDDAKVITDRDTGQSRGFGFVTFSDAANADAAMEELDGSMLDGRRIRVNEARSKERRGGRGGYRGPRRR